MGLVEKGLKALRQPREIPMEINAKWNWRMCGCDYNPNGIDVFDVDWDFLVILDSLRADDFAELNILPGNLSTRESRGGGTREFLQGNVRGRDLRDTVYVNGNPQFRSIYKELNTDFHAVESVWEDRWDNELETVHPASMVDATITAAEEYPNKRILIHFVQPHEPFIGSTAEEHDLNGWIDPNKSITVKEALIESVKNSFRIYDTNLYRQAYRENIKITLPYVKQIFNSLSGKFVVTSDHGEMFGERASPIPIKYDSHRIGCHVKELLEVPWLEYTHGHRREITKTEASVSQNSSNNQGVEDRLQQLGYL